jgi:cytochrome c oxidase assembly factor CtaG
LRAVVLVLSAAVLVPMLVLGTPDTTLLGRVAGEGNEPAGRVHRVIG